MAQKSLKQYKIKRDLKKSGEPKGGKPSKGKDKIFVVQEHNASRLHFDFRIEIDGALVSWAVPKGPSLNPEVKHLAIQTEDHPMDYANFEGIIPEGYGAGEVIVWDKGTYQNKRSLSMSESLKKGKIEIILKGKKLKGLFVLIKTKFGWLFFKAQDEYANTGREIIVSNPESVKSGKTIEDLAKKNNDAIRSGTLKSKDKKPKKTISKKVKKTQKNK
jgi:DNA ligase D-like protein (predicted 3'-phosphoesterase)